MKTFILLILMSFELFSQESLKGKALYVLTESAPLNMRSKAIDGPVIQKIKKGEKVKVLQIGGEVESIPYGWLEVEYGKKKGFVAQEFLSSEHPGKLEKLSIIASFRRDSEGNIGSIQPIAFSSTGKWIGVATDQSETYYFQKIAVKNKNRFTILNSNGKELGDTLINSVEKSGCQEIKVGKAKFSAKLSNIEDSLFAVHGVSVSPVKKNDKVSAKLKQEIGKLAKSDFLKKGVGEEKLSYEIKEEHSIIESEQGDFLVSRVAITKEGAEHANLIYIHEVKKNKIGKKMFTEFQSLSDEMMFYGGAFHLEGSFILNGKLILIFHDNGFDGYIKTIYEWDGKKFQVLATGGGDAC